MTAGSCTVCGDPRVRARGRCATCFAYWYRNGKDRSHKLIARLTEKDIEREILRRQRLRRGWDPNV